MCACACGCVYACVRVCVLVPFRCEHREQPYLTKGIRFNPKKISTDLETQLHVHRSIIAIFTVSEHWRLSNWYTIFVFIHLIPKLNCLTYDCIICAVILDQIRNESLIFLVQNQEVFSTVHGNTELASPVETECPCTPGSIRTHSVFSKSFHLTFPGLGKSFFFF